MKRFGAGTMGVGFVAFGWALSFGVVSIGMNAVGWIAVGLNAAGFVSLGLVNSVGVFAFGGVNACGGWGSGGTNADGGRIYGIVAASLVALALVVARVRTWPAPELPVPEPPPPPRREVPTAGYRESAVDTSPPAMTPPAPRGPSFIRLLFSGPIGLHLALSLVGLAAAIVAYVRWR
ncbi:MAG TPA: hypothetical protein VF737_02845 [Gemmatimonadaceae bacterium]